MKKLLKELKTPFLISISFLVICGIVYPLLLTGIGQLTFPEKANGSLIVADGKIVGSKLIGQDFTDSKFMKGRPSAINYNVYTLQEKEENLYQGVKSGSDNFASSNPKLKERIQQKAEEIIKNNPRVEKKDIPIDLITSSGSGLDPHISLKAALIQIPALSQTTGISVAKLEDIVEQNLKHKDSSVFGEQIVNVLGVNLAIAKELNQIKDISK